jgi:hypothetical protein
VYTKCNKRFIKLPAPIRKGSYNFPVTAIRLPSLVLYAKSEEATAFLKRFVPSRNHNSRETWDFARMMYDCLREMQLISGKPLELPFYLEADHLRRLACLKCEEGPAILVLCKPEDITRALCVLNMHFGKITYCDDQNLMNFTIQADKRKLWYRY